MRALQSVWILATWLIIACAWNHLFRVALEIAATTLLGSIAYFVRMGFVLGPPSGTNWREYIEEQLGKDSSKTAG